MCIPSHADGQQRVRPDEWLAFIPSLSVVHRSCQGHMFDISGCHGVVTQCHWVRFCCLCIATAGEASGRQCTCNTHMKIGEIPAWVSHTVLTECHRDKRMCIAPFDCWPFACGLTQTRQDTGWTHTQNIFTHNPARNWFINFSELTQECCTSSSNTNRTYSWTVCPSLRLFRPGGWLTASPLMCGVGGYRQTECGTSLIFPKAHTTHRVRHTRTHTHTHTHTHCPCCKEEESGVFTSQ